MIPHPMSRQRGIAAPLGRWAAVCFVVLSVGPARADDKPRPTSVDPLLRLLHDRLVLMHDVARRKWNDGTPIADPAHERSLLDAVAAKARDRGLDPTFVRRVFTAQIEAAKVVQQADHNRWKAAARGPFPDAPSLADLRAKIDALNEAILRELVDLTRALDDQDVRRSLPDRAAVILQGDGLDEAVRRAAIGPLTDLSAAGTGIGRK